MLCSRVTQGTLCKYLIDLTDQKSEDLYIYMYIQQLLMLTYKVKF